jgi:AcrR family transcriptional regulator
MEETIMTRKSKYDWLQTGLDILGRDGPNAMTIDRMALELGVTKGSFYHHFKNAADFEEQLLAHWANQYLATSGAKAVEAPASLALLDTLMEELFSPIAEPEIAIRMWATLDARARPHVEKIDRFRRRFLLEVFRSLQVGETQAQLMADMLYTITIGSIATLPRVPPERVMELYEEFKRLYGL